MQKFYKVLLATLITILVAIIIALFVLFQRFAYLVRENDISMQPTKQCNLNTDAKVWLISFADGNDIYFANQRTLNHSSLNNCVDFIKSYKADDLDSSFKEENKKILTQKRGAGYWLWKPYIILETLNNMPEGDILLYLDSGVKITNKLDNFLNNLDGFDILTFESYHSNKQYVKRDLLKIMNMDTEEARNAKHLQANFLALRNNEFTRNFIKKWLDLCKNERALTDIPSIEEYPEFIDHRHDQAILSLLYLQNADHFKILNTHEASKYFSQHRRRYFGEISLIIDKQHKYFKDGSVEKQSFIDRMLLSLLKKI